MPLFVCVCCCGCMYTVTSLKSLFNSVRHVVRVRDRIFARDFLPVGSIILMEPVH